MIQWMKELIKTLPGIRRVVEGRDRFIQLYEAEKRLNEHLQAQMTEKDQVYITLEKEHITLQDKYAKLQSNCASLRNAYTTLQSDGALLQNAFTEIQGEYTHLQDSYAALQQGHIELREQCRLNQEQMAQLQAKYLTLMADMEEKARNILEQQERERQLLAQLRQYDYRKNTEALSSSNFWENHYAQGGNSGTGSYNRLAEFKSKIVNQILQQSDIHTVLELGCGDGNQLKFIQYEAYVGVDVSPVIVAKNRENFAEDPNKAFYCTLTERECYTKRTYDLTVSMDVIFHLLEDSVFFAYLDDLFKLSHQYVVIYSSNHEEFTPWPEYRHRNFTGYVQNRFPDWELIQYIPNQYPYRIGGEEETSASDFFVYKKI